MEGVWFTNNVYNNIMPFRNMKDDQDEGFDMHGMGRTTRYFGDLETR